MATDKASWLRKAGRKSAWRKCGERERFLRSDLREAGFGPASFWQTAGSTIIGRLSRGVLLLILLITNCQFMRSPACIAAHGSPESVSLTPVKKASSCERWLSCAKRFATYGRINSIEDAQTIDIRYASNGDRIAEICDLAVHAGERRPLGKPRAIRIA